MHNPSWGQVVVSRPPSSQQGAYANYYASAFEPVVLPGLEGLPSALAFGFGITAVAVALAFDLLFLRIPIPLGRFGGYAWYLTTALSFMLAGYASAKWTRAGRGLGMFVIVFSAIGYAAADLWLGMVLHALSMHGATILAGQGLGIALVTGFSGVFKGSRAKAAAY
jgi:hypothetical protein